MTDLSLLSWQWQSLPNGVSVGTCYLESHQLTDTQHKEVQTLSYHHLCLNNNPKLFPFLSVQSSPVKSHPVLYKTFIFLRRTERQPILFLHPLTSLLIFSAVICPILISVCFEGRPDCPLMWRSTLKQKSSVKYEHESCCGDSRGDRNESCSVNQSNPDRVSDLGVLKGSPERDKEMLKWRDVDKLKGPTALWEFCFVF